MTINQLLEKISEIAKMQKIEIYPVGGFVRDRLLNMESKDIDFVVDAIALVASDIHGRVDFFAKERPGRGEDRFVPASLLVQSRRFQ